MIVRPDHVYVIPPGKNLSVEGGRFRLSEPPERRGMRLPIDFFFCSLASQLQAAATGVVLSGMGSDGQEGLRAIKAAGGRCFAQTPVSAQFDSMPQSAIKAGVVDAVGTPAELAAALMELAPRRKSTPERQPGSARPGAAEQADAVPGAVAPGAVAPSAAKPRAAKDERRIAHILDRVLLETGQDFSSYKPSIVRRRLDRRMGAVKASSLSQYAEIIDREPEEATLLAQSFLIGVTSFFRDPEFWDYLAGTSLPALLRRLPQNHVIRAWVPGCSTGEEAYTLAMVLTEALDQIPAHRRPGVRIFATDLDPDSIEFARQGLYEGNACQSIPGDRLSRWFTAEHGRHRVRAVIREALVFAVHDLIADSPFTKVDLVSCRNVMIYLEGDLQRRLIEKFHYCLNPGGFLLLGTSEAPPLEDQFFAQAQSQHKVYQRMPSRERTRSVPVPSRPKTSTSARRPMSINTQPADLNVIAAQALVDNFAPAAVVVNQEGDILHVLGKVGKYLEPSAGKASLNVFGMARSPIRRALAEALRAVTTGRAAKATRLGTAAKGRRAVPRITAKKLTAPGSLRGLLMVAFDEAQTAPIRAGSASAREYARALRRVEQELEEMRQENANAGQQLTTANEELQALNEEMQSANEELMTSKEETQSMNEELQTVNAELQSKLDTFTVVNNDLRNLLDSVDIAIIFLDHNLHIRRFTRPAAKIFRLIPGDIGRALTDVQTDLLNWDPKADVSSVLATLTVTEREIPASADRWYRVRILPYRASDNVIDGAVVTLTDISAAKRLERTLTAKRPTMS
jgi:two-component system CheB/CheR fusion protein